MKKNIDTSRELDEAGVMVYRAMTWGPGWFCWTHGDTEEAAMKRLKFAAKSNWTRDAALAKRAKMDSVGAS